MTGALQRFGQRRAVVLVLGGSDLRLVEIMTTTTAGSL